jgi:hypothetical protein
MKLGAESPSLWEGLGEGLAVYNTQKKNSGGLKARAGLINFVFALARPSPSPSQREGSKGHFQSASYCELHRAIPGRFISR